MNDTPTTPDEHAPESREPAWLGEEEPLPPARPRRRLLAPLPLSLIAVLLIACGFIAGVLVEKGQGGSTNGAAGGGGFAGREAALRSGSTGATGGGDATAGGAVTAGTVAYVSKGALYVTTSEGSTVKVKPVAGAIVTRTVASGVAHIHPGETVLVTGTTAANGAIAANSIRAGTRLGAGSLFGGGSGPAAGGTASGGGAGTSSGTGGEQPLFGKG
jgi:hypothetical protein